MDGEIFVDMVGKLVLDVELKIVDNGEVMYWFLGVFVGYFKNDEVMVKIKIEDGWVYIGDVGIIVENGYLKIIDWVKDVGKFNDGVLFVFKYIENKFKFFFNIKEVVVFGYECDMVMVFLNIDLIVVGFWVECNNVNYVFY